MLGSFPPSRKRWCMDFFYPNFNNDMWRIWGIVCFQDKDYFVDLTNKRFKQQEIETFLNEKGIALYDTACAVVRTKNTASDKDLEVVEETDIDHLLQQIPDCEAIVTTGQKATDILTTRFAIRQPAVGESVSFDYQGRTMRFYRMPSSSRAYPLALEKKAEKYKEIVKKFIVHSS